MKKIHARYAIFSIGLLVIVLAFFSSTSRAGDAYPKFEECTEIEDPGLYCRVSTTNGYVECWLCNCRKLAANN